MRLWLGLAALLVALVLASDSKAARRSVIVQIVDVGGGNHEAWVFLPEERPECVLTFIHDDGDLTPARYTSWLDYTVLRDHCAIVFPKYQLAARAGSARNLTGLRAGISTGLAYVRARAFRTAGARALASVPVIATGFGSGGTLAFTVATRASGWGFPAPIAIDTVFPVVNVLSPLPTAPLADHVHVLVQMGDRDRAAGPASGVAVRKYLASHPAGNIQVVHSTSALDAIHNAPLRVDSASENAFWGPLDALIDSVK
jgi:hypothetical protein